MIAPLYMIDFLTIASLIYDLDDLTPLFIDLSLMSCLDQTCRVRCLRAYCKAPKRSCKIQSLKHTYFNLADSDVLITIIISVDKTKCNFALLISIL